MATVSSAPAIPPNQVRRRVRQRGNEFTTGPPTRELRIVSFDVSMAQLTRSEVLMQAR